MSRLGTSTPAQEFGVGPLLIEDDPQLPAHLVDGLEGRDRVQEGPDRRLRRAMRDAVGEMHRLVVSCS